MALPENNKAWPPKALSDITPKLEEWSAWYEGTPEALRNVYQGQQAANFYDHPSQRRGGVVGALARFWWGRPNAQTGGLQRVDQLHIPIASDLCQASADLLYAEPPSFGVPEGKDAVKEYLERWQEGLHSELATGAEVGAALGGRYHRVTWDREIDPDGPFLTTVDADQAIPEFRWGRLVAVTFWKVVKSSGMTRIRHLERHELDSQGNGVVLHGLYEGTVDNLGHQIPLTEWEGTEGIVVDEDGVVVEGRTPGLLVEYVPNQRPNRVWRKHPVGRHLGRSDLAGVEGPMDALDEVYSSWMRDIRLAKSRILIPEYMLAANRPGQGASFDLDREVYVPVRSAAPEDGDATIVLNQFSIRVEEHRASVQELTEVILRTAGYSAQTFGEAEDGAAMTATEVTSRERRSYLTRDRKIRAERPAVSRLVTKMLSIQRDVFGDSAAEPVPVSVDFGDAIQEAPLLLAQTALALDQAGAASTEVKVQMVHPDWSPEQVKAEVELIRSQAPTPAPNPFE